MSTMLIGSSLGTGGDFRVYRGCAGTGSLGSTPPAAGGVPFDADSRVRNPPGARAGAQPFSTAAIASATASMFFELSAATQMRPVLTA